MNATFQPSLRTAGLREQVESWLAAGVLSWQPLQIVDAVAGRYGEQEPRVLLALALVLEAQSRGHSALDLRRGATALPADDRVRSASREEVVAPAWPEGAELDAWEADVLDSPLVGGADQSDRPFELLGAAGGRVLLMSRRMAADQRRLAKRLGDLATTVPSPLIASDRVEEALARLFRGETDSQGARALRLAAGGSITIITGGPGTGKTFSIKRLLALLLEEHPDLRILLAAPTGKAAVRMTEAMAEELGSLRTTDAIKERLKDLPASTVHKMLSIRPGSGETRYGLASPLPADVVVVDEASMLDVLLMRKLVESIGEGTRLVLLGDKDQLVSVESGTVLADLVAGHFGGATDGLAGRVAAFTVSHRFENAPTLAAIAAAVQAATPESLAEACEYLAGRAHGPKEKMLDRVRQLGSERVRGPVPPTLYAALAEPYLRGQPEPGQTDGDLPGYAEVLAGILASGGSRGLFENAGVLLEALGRYRVLATHRSGGLAVSGLNREIGSLVRERLRTAWNKRKRSSRPGPKGEAVAPAAPVREADLPTRGGLWLGEPVLVTENAYDVDLRNGDIGLVLPGPGGKLAVVFPVTVDGKPMVRSVSIARLPAHMRALAMTVHKAQGSQFREVALVLAGRPSPIQTRELVYTGVTRASARLSWVGTEEELKEALGRPVGRISALGAMIDEATAS